MNDSSKTSVDDGSAGPSGLLVVAALAGLMGVAVAGCSDDPAGNVDSSNTGGSHDDHDHDESGGSSSGSGGTGGDVFNDVIREDVEMTMDEFRAFCEERGGYTYVNAACATASMCRGLSLHDGTIWEHSCRGQNSSCSGIGCLDMPEDKGATGKELFEETACGDCHADWSKVGDDNPTPDYGKYAVFFDPKQLSSSAAIDRFKTSTDARLESIVVWGVSGFHEDHTPFSNMPTYYQKHSLTEIRRVIAYIRTLTPFEYPYEIFGEPDVIPDPGPSGSD